MPFILIITFLFSALFAGEVNLEENNGYKLFQNYPNPANPNTMIKFHMAEAGNVDLAVYNLIGQKLYQLTESQYSKGLHEIEFNAAALSSGLYIYRMEVAGKFMAVKKITILK